MRKVSIRQANNQDCKDIVELIFTIWQKEYQFDVKEEDFPDLQDIESHYLACNGLFFVALINSTVIATVACSQLSDNQYVLKRLFVQKHHRGKSIAQQLLNRLLESLPQQNIELYLSTKEEEAKAAKAFYLKHGFQIIGKSSLPDNFPYFYQDDLFMCYAR